MISSWKPPTLAWLGRGRCLGRVDPSLGVPLSPTRRVTKTELGLDLQVRLKDPVGNGLPIVDHGAEADDAHDRFAGLLVELVHLQDLPHVATPLVQLPPRDAQASVRMDHQTRDDRLLGGALFVARLGITAVGRLAVVDLPAFLADDVPDLLTLSLGHPIQIRGDGQIIHVATVAPLPSCLLTQLTHEARELAIDRHEHDVEHTSGRREALRQNGLTPTCAMDFHDTQIDQDFRETLGLDLVEIRGLEQHALDLGSQVRHHPRTVRVREGILEIQVVERPSEPGMHLGIGLHTRARLAAMHAHVHRDTAQYVMQDSATENLERVLRCVDRPETATLGAPLEPPGLVVSVERLHHVPHHRCGSGLAFTHDHGGLSDQPTERIYLIRLQAVETFRNRHDPPNNSHPGDSPKLNRVCLRSSTEKS